ncbi:MAG TPA: MFS transporter [Candidatus Deferrimicrobium sp.]|nr:MFS transporter [Candidatus Deferrimicrobium sp.]
MADTIWTKTFILLCAVQLLGYAQHFMLAPVLPLFLTQLGAPPVVVGIVLACFAVTSVVVRPLVGHWADRWSEAGVMIAGLLFQAVSIFLCFIPFVPAAALANGLRGIGWAGLNTGGYSLLALISPEKKRGAASGLYSGVQSSAQIFFPPFALWLLYASFGGYRLVFVVTAIFSIAGALTGWAMASSVPPPAKVHGTHKKTDWWREIFHFVEPEIFLPSLLLLWLNLSLPALTNFIILYAKELGIGNFAAYFVVIGATSMLGRPLLGRLSDRIGRARSIAAGFALQVIALILITIMSNLLGVIVCGAIYMLGNAIGSSTTLALAVERADPQRRGKQMATFSVAYPLSYGVGSLITGSAIDIAGYIGMFLLLAAIQAAGLLFAVGRGAKL